MQIIIMTPESDAPAPEQEYDSAGKIEFKKPDGLALPDGSKEGDEVEMVGTFRVEGDNLCLVAVEGMPVEKSGEPNPEPKPKPDVPMDGSMKYEDAVNQGL